MSVHEPQPKLSVLRRIEKFLFRFFGPAQLGAYDPAAPPTVDARCVQCGRPMSLHTYVETPERRRLRCPLPDAGAAG
jgi:hypothetical protein